jgi:hypothetical protein
MIDVSDGLAGDLRHLLKASGVGAELLASAIPISVAARTAARAPAQGVIEDSEIGKQQGQDSAGTGIDRWRGFRVVVYRAPAAQAVELTDAWREHFTRI